MPDDAGGPPAIPALDRCRSVVTRAVSVVHDAVAEYRARHNALAPGSRILVGLSGGPDSVALLTALSVLAPQANWVVSAAHVNYQWRGVDSDHDELLCQAYSQAWGFRLHVLRPESHGIEIGNRQAWARESRYAFFQELAERHGYDVIAIGHQINDRAETVAAAMVDAGGTFALAGIPPVRGIVVRPLYYCDRVSGLNYLKALQLPHRTDRSNADRHYQRNRVRHDILPTLKHENPSIETGLARLGEQLWQQHRYLSEKAEGLIKGSERGESPGRIVLDAGSLIAYDRALDPFVLRAILRRLGAGMVPTSASVERFQRWRLAEENGRFEQGGFVIERSKGKLVAWLEKEVRNSPEIVNLPNPGVIAFANWTLEARTIVSPFAAGFDDRSHVLMNPSAVCGNLSVRAPQSGDSYKPYQFVGHKKLKDLFADTGVPAPLRGEIPVVADEVGILWPVGFPIADRARVNAYTEHAIEITAVNR